jgi:hypothetical protein
MQRAAEKDLICLELCEQTNGFEALVLAGKAEGAE